MGHGWGAVAHWKYEGKSVEDIGVARAYYSKLLDVLHCDPYKLRLSNLELETSKYPGEEMYYQNGSTFVITHISTCTILDVLSPTKKKAQKLLEELLEKVGIKERK